MEALSESPRPISSATEVSSSLPAEETTFELPSVMPEAESLVEEAWVESRPASSTGGGSETASQPEETLFDLRTVVSGEIAPWVEQQAASASVAAAAAVSASMLMPPPPPRRPRPSVAVSASSSAGEGEGEREPETATYDVARSAEEVEVEQAEEVEVDVEHAESERESSFSATHQWARPSGVRVRGGMGSSLCMHAC